jgi:3-hydroxyacyl-[acyl-carrier-protein] dehydratase
MPDTLPINDDPVLREALKRCSAATYYAACKFKLTRRREDLRLVILGVIERFVERDLRPKLAGDSDPLRLREDLGLDSLTMMEVVMMAEEVITVSVSNEELNHLRTLGDVHAFFAAKLVTPLPGGAKARTSCDDRHWDLKAVGEDVRRIEAGASHPAPRLSS